ncbi:MAG: tetratricopeptide repeat-containing serine protease family protein [Cyanobacteriota bacterium]|nr:tetratricopeptide repeat-containing serine protease family protein [Cyanobacteriota bacterium]
MKSWRWLFIVGTLPLLLVGCNFIQTPRQRKISPQEIKKSVVLISYENQGGHGSGFFVEGEKGVCTVLTARHVTLTEMRLKLKTKDEKTWDAVSIRRFPNHDLALVEFKPEGKNCSYQSLPLGDSDRVAGGDIVRISGYFNSGGRLVNHVVNGRVTAIDELPEGYGIAYDATTGGGMSGGPVVNEMREVIAIHGRSDTEILELTELKGESVPSVLQAAGSQASVFKWGIPTQIYLVNRDEAPKVAAGRALTAEDYLILGHWFVILGRYDEALGAYKKALDIQPNLHEAWYSRGIALQDLGKYEEAIASYDKALDTQPILTIQFQLPGNFLAAFRGSPIPPQRRHHF